MNQTTEVLTMEKTKTCDVCLEHPAEFVGTPPKGPVYYCVCTGCKQTAPKDPMFTKTEITGEEL